MQIKLSNFKGLFPSLKCPLQTDYRWLRLVSSVTLLGEYCKSFTFSVIRTIISAGYFKIKLQLKQETQFYSELQTCRHSKAGLQFYRLSSYIKPNTGIKFKLSMRYTMLTTIRQLSICGMKCSPNVCFDNLFISYPCRNNTGSVWPRPSLSHLFLNE